MAALLLTITVLAAAGHPATFATSAPRPDIPRTWDQAAITSVTIPLATRAASPVPISADYYYRMPVRPVFRTYPVYAPDREPRGYLDSLRRLNPEIVFDAATLATETDWTKAGELVFDAPIAFEGEPLEIARLALVRDPAWYRATGVPVTKDGIMPFARYIIRKPGVVEVGSLACAMCHTRVMPDGTVIKGAQGNERHGSPTTERLVATRCRWPRSWRGTKPSHRGSRPVTEPESGRRCRSPTLGVETGSISTEPDWCDTEESAM